MMPLLGVRENMGVRQSHEEQASKHHFVMASPSPPAFSFQVWVPPLPCLIEYNLRVVKLNKLPPLWFAFGQSFITSIETLIKTPWVTEVTVLKIVQEYYLLCIPSSQWLGVTSKAFKSPAPLSQVWKYPKINLAPLVLRRCTFLSWLPVPK